MREGRLMMCKCGRTMVELTLDGQSYWACEACDANGRCRRCLARMTDGDNLRVAAHGIGLRHAVCPDEPDDGVSELGPDDAVVIRGVVFTVGQIERLAAEAGIKLKGDAGHQDEDIESEYAGHTSKCPACGMLKYGCVGLRLVIGNACCDECPPELHDLRPGDVGYQADRPRPVSVQEIIDGAPGHQDDEDPLDDTTPMREYVTEEEVEAHRPRPDPTVNGGVEPTWLERAGVDEAMPDGLDS